MTRDSRDLDLFLRKFFGEGNELRQEYLEKAATSLAQCTKLWLEEFRKGRHRRLFLPRLSQGELSWYAIDFGDGNEFRELLLAFVGPSYSTFRGERAELSAGDPVDKAVLHFVGSEAMVFRFKASTSELRRQQLESALLLMHQVTASAEDRPRQIPRSVGSLIRDFHIALAAGKRDDAEMALDCLWRNRMLDALNLRFLQVQLLDTLGRSKEIVELPVMGDLVRVRRPRAVTRALMQAIYRLYLAEFEERQDVSGACKAFRDSVLPRFRALYSTRMGFIEPEILKSFMLMAVAGSPQQPTLRDELLQIPSIPYADHQYLQSLSRLIPATTPTPPTVGIVDAQLEARVALENGQYDLGLHMAGRITNKLDRARLVLECAYELQTIDSMKSATDAFEALSPEDRKTLLASRRYAKFWASIVGETPDIAVATSLEVRIPSSWIEWLEMLSSETIPAGRLSQLAEAGAEDWSVEELASSPDKVDSLVRALDQASHISTLHRETLFDCLPYLLRFLERDEQFPRKVLAPVYEIMRMVLCYSCEIGTASDLTVYGELCAATLGLCSSARAYSNVMAETIYLCERFTAPHTIQPILDILDWFVYFACPLEQVENRNRLASMVFAKALPWVRSGRLNLELWRFMRQLASELQLTSLFEGVIHGEDLGKDESPEIGEEDPLGTLRGSVAIYTLTEPAGVRAKQILERRSPNCHVQVNCDKVGSDRLRHLAQSADIFIMVISSAKHAATHFIEANRGKKPILRPAGKGTSSILSELVRYMTSDSTGEACVI